LDLSTFEVTKHTAARMNRMEAVNMQSDQIAQAAGGFMSAAFRSNVVGMFACAGFVLTLDSEGRLFCRVCPEKVKCCFNPIEVVSDPVPTDEEVEELEHKLHLDHMAEIIIDEMQQITE
jgi:hypothetical protein